MPINIDENIHKSVLPAEILKVLKPEAGEIFVDATLGLGGHTEAIFGQGGGAKMCADFGVEFLGALPLTMAIRQQTDSGTPTVVAEPDGPVAVIYKQIARTIAIKVAEKAKDMTNKFPSIVIKND